jgi:hypothetical protein
MRRIATCRAARRVRAVALLAYAVCLLTFAAPVFASSPEPIASPSQEPAPAVLTCVLSRATVLFANSVAVTGVLTPAAEAQEVVVTIDGVEVGRAVTDAAGTYALTITPRRSGGVVASLAADPAVASEPQAVMVKVGASVSHGTVVPFLRARFVVRVAPLAYDGVVTAEVVHRRVVVGTYRARVRGGRAVFEVPLRGIDWFTLSFTLPAGDRLAGRTVQSRVQARYRTLSAGSTGSLVKGMLTAFDRLRIRVPGVGTRFTTQVKDSVMTFQKAYRLPRTYVFDRDDWRKLDGAKTIRPRHPGPSTHLEVDKTRQILMVVKNGQVVGLICVSTGATGNTPEGTFRIRTKYPYTTSGYGGILVRTMGFIGDFAIHGYTPVPPYPASHGCVREPIWACTWVYDQSSVGETLHVYR